MITFGLNQRGTVLTFGLNPSGLLAAALDTLYYVVEVAKTFIAELEL